MSIVRRVSLLAAFALAALSACAPAAALTASLPGPLATPVMFGGAAVSAVPTLASQRARQIASEACVAANAYGPASIAQSVADGMGDWLVWVKDRDGDLWSCNADGEGLVYVNVFVGGDMLEGHGAEFLADRQASAVAAEAPDVLARDLCVGVAGLTQDVTVVAVAEDGLGDMLVWLRLADGQLWMCNASAEAELYVFEPVGFPIGEEDERPVLSAEASPN